MVTPRYASVDNPTIQAIIHELYRFRSAAEATEQLHALRDHFTISKRQLENPVQPSVILWIKGYAVTETDQPHGIIGHYAILSCKPIGNKFCLSAMKLEIDVRQHPQRKLIKRDTPNWGHPVLRNVRKGKNYAGLEEAQAELTALHEAYPKISIPNPNKLYIMIYCAQRETKARVVKHVLEIKTREDGNFFIEIKENTSKPLPSPDPKKPATPQGYFTSKIALSKKRRPKKT